jgi:hypothetical protein
MWREELERGGRSKAVNDQWDCGIGRADSAVIALLAGAPSEFGTFGTTRCGIEGFGWDERHDRRSSFECSLEIQGYSKLAVKD